MLNEKKIRKIENFVYDVQFIRGERAYSARRLNHDMYIEFGHSQRALRCRVLRMGYACAREIANCVLGNITTRKKSI
jgi:hypothetical protein